MSNYTQHEHLRQIACSCRESHLFSLPLFIPCGVRVSGTQVLVGLDGGVQLVEGTSVLLEGTVLRPLQVGQRFVDALDGLTLGTCRGGRLARRRALLRRLLILSELFVVDQRGIRRLAGDLLRLTRVDADLRQRLRDRRRVTDAALVGDQHAQQLGNAESWLERCE